MGGAPAPRPKSAEGSQDAHGEEPDPGGTQRGRVPGAPEGVGPSGLAVPRSARARARDRTPDRSHTLASVAGHRLRGRGDPVACRAGQVGLRTRHARHRRGAGRSRRGAEDEPRNRRSAGASRAQEPAGVSRGRTVARLVEQGPDSCGPETDARQGLALAEAQVCLGPDGPAAEGALPTRRVEDGQNGASMLSASRRGTASERTGRPPSGSRLKSRMAGVNQRESGLPNT